MSLHPSSKRTRKKGKTTKTPKFWYSSTDLCKQCKPIYNCLWFMNEKVTPNPPLSAVYPANNNNYCTERRSLSSFFQTISSLCPVLPHKRWSGQGAIVCKSCAKHRALITHNMSCAIWYEETAELLSLTRVEIAFMLALFIGWMINW